MGIYTKTEKFYDIVGGIARTNPNMTLNEYTKYQSNLKEDKYNLSGDIFVLNLITAFDNFFGNKKLSRGMEVPAEKIKTGENLTFSEILNCRAKAKKNTYSSCFDNYFSVIDTVLKDTDTFFKYKNMFGDSMNSDTWSRLSRSYDSNNNGGVIDGGGIKIV